MGLGQSRNKSEVTSSYYYIDPTGIKVEHKKVEKHSRKDELSFLNKESSVYDPKEECYIIDAHWLDKWLEFCNKKQIKVVPGAISNHALLDLESGSFKISLRLRDDFRIIKKSAWVYLYKLYGGGPVIYFHG